MAVQAASKVLQLWECMRQLEGASCRAACTLLHRLLCLHLITRPCASWTLTVPASDPHSPRLPCPALCRQYNLLTGESITADLYVSAMPVDIVKKLMPEPWGRMDFFS